MEARKWRWLSATSGAVGVFVAAASIIAGMASFFMHGLDIRNAFAMGGGALALLLNLGSLALAFAAKGGEGDEGGAGVA